MPGFQKTISEVLHWGFDESNMLDQSAATKLKTIFVLGNMFGLGGIRYRGENIMRLSLDRGGRTTRDYEGPQVAPRVQAALDAAMHNVEPDIEVDVSALNARVGQAPVRGFRKHGNGNHSKKSSKSCTKDSSGSGGSSSQVGEAYPSSRGLVPKWDKLASAESWAIEIILNVISVIAFIVILFDFLFWN